MLSTLDAAFGDYDLSTVGFEGGETGGAMADAVGAEAFATGDLIAAEQPDLYTMAHEAAHVIQQRGDPAGESAEREAHADEVAEAVVAGESAAPLLAEVADPEDTDAAPGSVERMKRSGAPVDLSTLTDKEVLQHIGTIRQFGPEPVQPATSIFEYEVGDTAALELRQAGANFGQADITTLDGLLGAGDAVLNNTAGVVTHDFTHIAGAPWL